MAHIAKIELKSKLFVFVAPFLILFFALLIHQYGSEAQTYDCTNCGSGDKDSEIYARLFGVEQIGEWLQFVFYLMAGLIGIMSWRLLKKKHGKEKILLSLFFISCLFLAFEEISWGQHIFKWEVPAIFQEINLQKETNLHNTKGINLHILFMFVGFFGGASWILKNFRKNCFLDLLCPDWQYASYFFPVFFFYFYFDFVRPHFYIIGNHQELFEFILSCGFLLIASSNYRKIANFPA